MDAHVHRYNREAVGREIDRINRRTRGSNRIGRREAGLIHAILKGRQKDDT